ncbi:MAG: phosphonate ABC transporter, permease protein PhnE [Anaeromyxobacteraceae bacterium]
MAVVAVAWRVVDGDLALLVSKDARGAMADFARGFWPPAHDAGLLALLARPLVETLAIAFLGMTVALALALPLSMLAADPALLVAGGERPSAARRAAWMAARGLLNLMRSIPEIVWALVFVRAVGMGPTAGVLAIGIGYGGIVGKVFAETFESTPRGPSRALAAAGARPAGAFLFGVLPGALPLLSSYTLYRLDCALRASAVLGLVGAGGIGLQLELSIKMFAWDEVAAMVLGLFGLVAALDLASRRLRRRIHASRGFLPAGRRGAAVRLAIPVAWLSLAAGAVAFLRLPLGELFSLETPRSAWAFVASTWPPDVSPAFLRQLGPAVLETLAVSVVGIAIAVALGLPLALLAARRGPSAALARVLLALGRTLPELLWALLVIFAVGLGPFAGALALGLHTAGVLGRLHAEALEEVPQAPVLALRAMGAPALSAEAFAAWPQAFPQLAAYTLYRWEVAIRASAVLGVVGAGGLGQLLHVSLSLFHHHRTATLVLAIVLLVTAVDLFSGWLRARILAGRPLVAAAATLEAA